MAGAWIQDLRQDVRFALRGLGRTPAFTATALLSLGIGLGVNTGLFTIFREVVMRPVPGLHGADRIVEALSKTRNGELQSWNHPDFEAVRAAHTPLVALAGWQERSGSLTTDGAVERVRTFYVSADYFRVLGVAPSAGRGFTPADDRPGGSPIAIVSHDLWQEQLGRDPDVIGRTITLNRAAVTVVGLAPEGFHGHRVHGEADLWLPLAQHPYMSGDSSLRDDPDAFWLRVLGRLEPGATVAEANAALETVFAALARDFPASHRERGARAAPFGRLPAHGRSQQLASIAAIFALVGLVLVVISGNVAGMVLARSATRQEEIAVRLALGAPRGRLVRLLMVEAWLLAVGGCGLGVVLALVALNRLAPVVLGTTVPVDAFRPDAWIVVCSLAAALGTTLVFGLLPALRFSRPDLLSALKDDAGSGGRRVGRVHRVAATCQTGVAIVLLIVCGLFVRTVGQLNRMDHGFDPEGLSFSFLDLSLEGYADLGAAEAFLQRLTESTAALPGVTSVAVADGLPADLTGNFTGVRRGDAGEAGEAVTVEFTRTTEGFFRTIGTALRGRDFASTDDASAPPVVIVTRSLAERLWPEEDAIGQTLRFTTSRESPRPHTVVGVVPNVAASRIEAPTPQIFVPLRQSWRPHVALLVRTAGPAPTLVRPLETAILDADPRFPHPHVETAEALLARGSEGQRIAARVTAGLGILALVLTAIGVYGVIAFTVVNRTREIGLRMALGATRACVLRSVLVDALRVALPGLAVGVLGAAGIALAMRAMLVGLNPFDPPAFVLATGLLLLVVLVASWVPARRAASVDPFVALRR